MVNAKSTTARLGAYLLGWGRFLVVLVVVYYALLAIQETFDVSPSTALDDIGRLFINEEDPKVSAGDPPRLAPPPTDLTSEPHRTVRRSRSRTPRPLPTETSEPETSTPSVTQFAIGGAATIAIALLLSVLRTRTPNLGAVALVLLSFVAGAYETHALWASLGNKVPFVQDSFPTAVALGLTMLACSEGISLLSRPRQPSSG